VRQPDTFAVALVALPSTREAAEALGLELAGATVIHRTLAALEPLEGLAEILLAGGPAPPPAPLVRELQAPQPAGRPPVRVTGPAQSAWAALRSALDAAAPADAVLLLDANRPLASPAHLAALLAEAGRFPAVLSATPVRSTCKRVSGGTVTSTLARERLLHTRRPAAFQRRALEVALAQAGVEGGPLAGDVALCRRAGIPVRVLDDDPGCLPVETAADAELAQLALRPTPLAR
jgi:2-C-methyl-D-erythritol 4-phosphate cytidylyltransferase